MPGGQQAADQLLHDAKLAASFTTCFNYAGADPGFLMRGFKWPKGGSFRYVYLNFHKISHEIEIILSERGVRANPLNPLWIRHCY